MPQQSWNDLLNEADAAGGASSYDPIPPNDYDFIITGAELKKTGTGKDMFKATCKVENGPHEGRLVWHNFTVSPESPKAMAMFFRYMGVLGLTRENFWSQNPANESVVAALHNRRFRGKVTIRQSDQYGDSNEIKNFSTPVGPVASAGVPGGFPTPQAPAAAPVAPQTPQAPPAAPPAAPAAPAAPVYEQPQTPAAPPAPPAAPAAPPAAPQVNTTAVAPPPPPAL